MTTLPLPQLHLALYLLCYLVVSIHHNAIYKAADPDHNVHIPDSSVSTITPTVSIQAPMDPTVVTHFLVN